VAGEELKFWAKVFMTLPSPTLGLAVGMDGMWCGAFGFKPLCIGDIAGEISVMPSPPFIASLALGGTIKLGTVDPITGKLYFKLDLAQPVNNYFYAHVSKFTIGQFLSIIAGISTRSIPAIIADTGFDKGVLFSYSLTAVTLPSGDDVPIGVQIKGGVNFFGWKARGEVLFSPTSLLFHFEMDKIIFGPFTFVRSMSDMANGPLLHLKASLMPPMEFEAKMKAYLDLFIFKAMVDIEISRTRFSVFVKAPIFGFLMGTINVTATYEGLTSFNKCSFDSMTFYFYARIDTTEITTGIINSIKAIEQKVTGAMMAARKKLDEEELKAVAKIDKGLDCSKCHIKCHGKQYLELAAEVLGTNHALVQAQTAETIEHEKNIPALLQLADAVSEAMKVKETVFLQLEAELEASKQSEESSCHWADVDCAKARLETYAVTDEEFMLAGQVQHQGFFKKVGKAFKKAGGAIKKVAHKAGGAIKRRRTRPVVKSKRRRTRSRISQRTRRVKRRLTCV